MPYTAGDYLIQTRMSAASLLPQDTIVNDFAFRRAAGAPSDAQLDQLMFYVGEFFRAGEVAADRVGHYISEWISREVTHEIAAYKIQAGNLGSPARTMDWLGPVASGTQTSMPPEVAAVVSFHGNLTGVQEEAGATRPRARRRGRIFVGPLNGLAIDEHLPDARLAAFFTGVLRSQCVDLADNVAALGWSWSVWSRANAELYPVVGGWTDNAPDTQRRRGVQPTARVVFNI